jgi:hypothetical protein
MLSDHCCFILLFCGVLYAFITQKLKAGYFIFATGLLILTRSVDG